MTMHPNVVPPKVLILVTYIDASTTRLIEFMTSITEELNREKELSICIHP